MSDVTTDSRPTRSGASVPRWPLSFRSTTGDNAGRQQQNGAPPARLWSYDRYRGPQGQPPQVLYSRDKARSEDVAQEFLGEAVVGFDMEWPYPETTNRMKDKAALIQVASESKIGLFHIALHSGDTAQDLIAPSLRKIIESPDIIKVGVRVWDLDLARLRKYFGLQPRGALELSHLHKLVRFGAHQPEQLKTGLVSLADQTKEHLGLPLPKGAVRQSRWDQPLTPEQIKYAANDAYAGFMLYHCMNAKRARMQPLLPLPVLADHYAHNDCDDQRLPTRSALCLQAPVTALEYCARLKPQSNRAGFRSEAQNGGYNTARGPGASHGHNGESAARVLTHEEAAGLQKLLYHKLCERRQQYATAQNLRDAYMIAPNSTMELMAELRPLDMTSLLKVKGIGQKLADKYGAGWLDIIQNFVDENPTLMLPLGGERRGVKRPASFHAPQKREAVPPGGLHTGISFQMDQTGIADEHPSSDDSDTSAFGPTLDTPPRAKRRRSDDDQDINHDVNGNGTETNMRPTVNKPHIVLPGPATPQVQRPQHAGAPVSGTQPQKREFRRTQSYDKAPGVQPFQTQETPVSASQPVGSSLPRSNPQNSAPTPAQTLGEKLRAFSKQIASRNGSNPIWISDATVNWIIAQSPESEKDLLYVPGIRELFDARKKVGVSLSDSINDMLDN